MDSCNSQLLSLLEAFLEAALREAHAEWKDEGLDGLLPELMRKTADNLAELAGHCNLISDQTMAPVYVRLRVAHGADEIDWFECRLGECGPNGLIRIPYNPEGLAVADRVRDIEWFYIVGFGERGGPTERAPD